MKAGTVNSDPTEATKPVEPTKPGETTAPSYKPGDKSDVTETGESPLFLGISLVSISLAAVLVTTRKRVKKAKNR